MTAIVEAVEFGDEVDSTPAPQPPPATDSRGGTEAPREVTGISSHGRAQIEGRNGGHGVSDAAIEDAVANPVGAPTYDAERDTWRVKGEDATVVLNPDGVLVTAWPNTSKGYRYP